MKCGHRRAIHPHREVNFEGLRLLLGFAYVQLHKINRGRLRGSERVLLQARHRHGFAYVHPDMNRWICAVGYRLHVCSVV